MRLDFVKERIEQACPDLVGRVEGGAQLSALARDGNLGQVAPALFILPLGLRGAPADITSGLYRQAIDESVGVVIVLEAFGDGTGAAALPDLSGLVDQIVMALVGSAPDGAVGAFQLTRGQLVSLSGGTLVYQLDFSISDQLRFFR